MHLSVFFYLLLCELKGPLKILLLIVPFLFFVLELRLIDLDDFLQLQIILLLELLDVFFALI